MISSDGPSRRDETRDHGQRRRPPAESLHLLSAVVVWLVTGTTISSLNKWIFAVYNFRYPLLLSALHMLTAIVVDYGLIKYYFVRHRNLCQQDLTTSAKCKVFLLSLTFCASIAFGNLGLNYVQLSFAQMIYTTTPIFTLAISSLVLGKQHHVIKYTAMMPICIGASFSILGEVQFDQTGCLFVVAATMLRGVKSIQQSILLQEEKINSVLLLYLMAIPSFCILAVAALVLENWAGLQSPLHYDGHLWAFIVLSCLGSVLYNLASCCVISLTSAVTLHILGNLSLVGNLLLSQLLFGSQFSALSCAGAALTLSGMIIYQNSELIVSYVDARRTRTRSETNLVSGRMPEPKLEPFLEAAQEQSLEFSSEPFTELNTDPETSSDLYEDTEPYQELYQFKQEPSQAQDHDEEPYLELSNILESHSEPSGESFLVLDGDVEPSSQLFNREMFHAPEPVLSLDSDIGPSLHLSDDLEPASEPSRELYHDPELFNVLETSSKSSGKPSLNPEPYLSLVSDVELSSELSNVLESALGSSKKFHHDLEPLPGLNDHLEPFLERSESEQSSREQDHEIEPSTELSDILESAPESFKALWHNVTPSLEQSVTLSSKISTETEPSSEKPQEIDSDLMSSSEP